MAKVHLLDREIPLVGGDEPAICGLVIKNAVVVCMWDEQGMGEVVGFGTANICRKCRDKWLLLNPACRYVYAVTHGSE